MKKLVQLLGLLVLSIPLTVLKMFVITKVWALTVGPMFHLPEITKWQAFTIAYLVTTISSDGSNEYKDKEIHEVFGQMFGKAVGLLLTWGIAYWIFG